MAAAMVYSGGTWARLLTNATVHPIFYGPVKRVPEILSFYASVGNTPWFEVMAQYNITSMQLGTPVYINATQPSIDNLKDLQPLLKSLIASGDIQPNENTYYPVHIAPGINVTNQVGKGCVNWCGFHTAHWISGWSKTVNWFPLVYGVVMDQSGGCGGCDVFGISAHELAESLTDPVPYGGWASSTATGNLEVADVCNGMYGKVKTYNGTILTVQRIWSNSEGKCVLSKGIPTATTTTITLPPTTTASAAETTLEPPETKLNSTLAFSLVTSPAFPSFTLEFTSTADMDSEPSTAKSTTTATSTSTKKTTTTTTTRKTTTTTMTKVNPAGIPVKTSAVKAAVLSTTTTSTKTTKTTTTRTTKTTKTTTTTRTTTTRVAKTSPRAMILSPTTTTTTTTSTTSTTTTTTTSTTTTTTEEPSADLLPTTSETEESISSVSPSNVFSATAGTPISNVFSETVSEAAGLAPLPGQKTSSSSNSSKTTNKVVASAVQRQQPAMAASVIPSDSFNAQSDGGTTSSAVGIVPAAHFHVFFFLCLTF